jgi:hypothetical protein
MNVAVQAALEKAESGCEPEEFFHVFFNAGGVARCCNHLPTQPFPHTEATRRMTRMMLEWLDAPLDAEKQEIWGELRAKYATAIRFYFRESGPA